MKIEDIDKNLVVETTITEPDLVWLDAKEAPFEICGLLYDGELGRYLRMPQQIAEGVSVGVSGSLNKCTAGGRVRFRTDSAYIAIRAVMDNGKVMSHMPLTGQSGFDIYRVIDGRDTYYRTFVPPRGVSEGYSSGHYTDGSYTDYTINFPLYDKVKELYVALKRGARISPPTPYVHQKPVVFYGNSITQGGCASRPGNAYEAILSRRLSCDHVNLGFSGSGCGEAAMAEYIATLDMSVLVMDYDANSPSEETLRATHYPFYRIVRDRHPDLPIIFISSSGILLKKKTGYGDSAVRRGIIYETYTRAKEAGDKNVYFIGGEEIFAGEDWDACTVDGSHPNDLGFYRYAMRIEKTLKPLLDGQNK